jgi:serine/threonine-protein kinase RsbW
MNNTYDDYVIQQAEFPGSFASLAPISDFVAQAAQAADLDERAVRAVQLAVDEACSNIIQHAYGGEESGSIDLTCRIEHGRLTVILRDEGRRFDPDSVVPPDLDAPLEERAGGNLGLYFMRNLMDEVRFDFTAQGNVLTMVKRAKEKA